MDSKSASVKASVPEVKLEAQCVMCEKTWTMTPEQEAAARSFGCATCPDCGGVATVERVSVKNPT